MRKAEYRDGQPPENSPILPILSIHVLSLAFLFRAELKSAAPDG